MLGGPNSDIKSGEQQKWKSDVQQILDDRKV